MIAPKEACPTWKILSYAIPIIIILVSVGGLIVATGNGDKLKPKLLSGVLQNDEIEDPFSRKSADGTVGKWKSDGRNGLEIEVLNAMSADWDVFFSLAVADWEYGNPDALSIIVEDVQEEKACKPIDGKVSEPILAHPLCLPSAHLVLHAVRKNKGLQRGLRSNEMAWN